MAISGAESTDPYGPEANDLLQPLQSDIVELARQLADRLYDTMARKENTARILNWLRHDEFNRLKQQQAQHIVMLLSADLTRSSHLVEAQRAGQAHALVGVQVLWLIETYSLYQEEIHRFLRTHIPESEPRELLMEIVSQRILLDLEGQVSSFQNINAEITAAFAKIDQHVMSTSNLTDLVRGALDILGELSGEVSAYFARVDDRGELQIEQSYGVAADQYHLAMESGEVPRISIDPNITAGRGPGGRAWRSGEIVVSDAWLIESDKAPWRHIGEKLGFRSSAAVPLLDESGRSIAMLSLYSAWPGFFSADRVQGLFNHVQRMLSHAIQQCMSAPVIPLREQQAYRLMLNEQRVVIHYQPIINLHDGSLAKIEALARMKDIDGKFISPQRFLPALGRDELLQLFEQGLKQACADCQRLKTQQIDTKIAINFPVEGFDDPRYEEALFQIMADACLTPDHLQLEVLETQDSGEMTESRNAFIQRLIDAGVEIAEDDLGSGHSSLLRLDQYAFAEVKIDQGLVRGVMHNPKRAVEFILYLTRLAHAFNIPVTVEGLENVGMIEAAAILGADRGQGYSIARPMPVDDLPAWCQSYHYSIHPNKPKTAIGALAGYLLWDMQITSMSERPELVTEFVGAKALVDEFIAANGLQGSAIDELLRRNHELASVRHEEKEEASIVRTQLIQELTDHWQAEVH